MNYKDKQARAMIKQLALQKMDSIDANHIFVNTFARDSYFSSNPDEKRTGILIQIIGTGFQVWDGSSWIAESGIIKGDKGDTGLSGIPTGGTTGQVLAKINGTNYNTQWIDAPTGSSGSVTWADITEKPTIPTTLASLTDDAEHRLVTDTEKATWNAKASTSIATTSANGLMSSTDKSKLDNIENSVTYTNALAVPTTIGGIASGTTFSTPKTMQEMFDTLLYPYQAPTFSSFNITGLTNPLEVGDVISSNPTFTWVTTNSSNINANTIVITDVTGGNTVLSNNITNDGTESVTLASIQKTTATSHQFKISATNTQSGSFNKTLTVNWQWKRFYGESANTSLTEANIKALRINGLSTGFAGTYSFNGGGYKYICYPSSFGTATTFKDQSTNLTVPFDTVTTAPVTNGYGITTTYNVHKSTNIMGSAITIIVS